MDTRTPTGAVGVGPARHPSFAAGHTMERLLGRALPKFQHLPKPVGYNQDSGLAVADVRGDNGSLACLLARRPTPGHRDLDRAEMLHAVRATLAQHFMLPRGRDVGC